MHNVTLLKALGAKLIDQLDLRKLTDLSVRDLAEPHVAKSRASFEPLKFKEKGRQIPLSGFFSSSCFGMNGDIYIWGVIAKGRTARGSLTR
jgi:hypothetical protein